MKYDRLERKYFQSGFPCSIRRLEAGISRGYFKLTPKELALYKSKHRTGALLGDFYYAVEAFVESVDIYKRLLDGEFGRLAKAEEASVRHRLAGTFFLAGRQREAEKLLDPFLCSNRLDSTPSAGAALKALANVKFLHYNENRIKPYENSLRCYLKAIKVAKDPEVRCSAMEMAGLRYAQLWKVDKAEEILLRLLKEYPEHPGKCSKERWHGRIAIYLNAVKPDKYPFPKEACEKYPKLKMNRIEFFVGKGEKFDREKFLKMIREEQREREKKRTAPVKTNEKGGGG